MLMGIDVGGTFTDGVLFHEGEVRATAKYPTYAGNIKDSVLEVLDALREKNRDEIKRVVLSTTLVTNLLATGRGERTALIMIPGYGLPHHAYDPGKDVYFIKGGIDFRGREIEKVDQAEIDRVIDDIIAKGITRVAVACKFSNRNDNLEKLVELRFTEKCPDVSLYLSSRVSGKLNFPRRATTAYFTALTMKEWNNFVDQIEAAFQERNIKAEVHILKADGGTMPLDVSRQRPCETVFSGPAASTMGAVALTGDKTNTVVVDIGGTTTDISLLIGGEPLYASHGAKIEGKFTQINAFSVRSIALGGDSVITCRDNRVRIGPERLGPAACFGGEAPTVTDVYNLHFKLGLGDVQKSQRMLEEISRLTELDQEALCAHIVHMVTERLSQSIEEMFREWENEPAYKVWEVIHRRQFDLERLVGIGAAAPTIVPLLAEAMGVECFLHQYSPVANALGAAVVRPTLAVNVHVDTGRNIFTVDPGALSGSLDSPRQFQLEDARNLARSYLKKIGQQRGLDSYLGESSFYMEEQFNMIRGWDRVGKIYEIGIQIAPGFIDDFRGVK